MGQTSDTKTILVVDDDPSTLKLVSSIVSQQGYGVLTAVDGLDALVSLKRDDPDLVLLDIEMPEVNGYDVCYQLRFNKEFHEIPIILMTKRDKEFDDTISKRINISYVPKPIDSNQLVEQIKILLEKEN